GGEGSGHHGHRGRPGEVGGSQPSDDVLALEKEWGIQRIPAPKKEEPVTLKLWRGEAEHTPVDEGMYGKGTYFTPHRHYAEGFAHGGKLIEAEVTLNKPFVAPTNEVRDLGRDAKRAVREAGGSMREANDASAKNIRWILEEMGYDGIIMVSGDYDLRPNTVTEVVVFDRDSYKPISIVKRGGPGSGHEGHRGRQGEVGGSLPSGGAGAAQGEKTRLYRGTSTHNKGGGLYYSPSKDFAMQFTQSGQESEIREIELAEEEIYTAEELPFAGDVDAIDAARAEAEKQGKKAIRASEGENQPPSVMFLETPDYQTEEGAGQEIQAQAVQQAKVRIRHNPNLPNEAQAKSTKDGVDVELGENFWKITDREGRASILAHEVGHEIMDRYLSAGGSDFFWNVSDSLTAPASEQWGGETPNFIF
ncbi:MAG: hypothetical protein KAI64_01805, partial [Thermoplasmata archaeon]|nr:hypothetical protein [Thermoplasmata archaeon]